MPTVDVRPHRQPGVPPCHGAAVRAGGWSAGIMPRPTRPARARSGSEGPSSSVRQRSLTPGSESVVRLRSCVGRWSSADSAGRIVRRSGVLSCKLLISKRAPVAQLDRASASGADHALADNPEFPGFIGEIAIQNGSHRVRKGLAEHETAGSTAGSRTSRSCVRSRATFPTVRPQHGQLQQRADREELGVLPRRRRGAEAGGPSAMARTVVLCNSVSTQHGAAGRPCRRRSPRRAGEHPCRSSGPSWAHVAL